MRLELDKITIGTITALMDHWGEEPCCCPRDPEHIAPEDRCKVCLAKSVLATIDDVRENTLGLEASERALADWELLRGKVVFLHAGLHVHGYPSDSASSGVDAQDIVLETPALVWFSASENTGNILHWNARHLDPHWDIHALLNQHPQLSLLRSMWIDGRSHQLALGGVSTDTWPSEIFMVDESLFKGIEALELVRRVAGMTKDGEVDPANPEDTEGFVMEADDNHETLIDLIGDARQILDMPRGRK
jgi:hypothetical protein